MAQEALANYPIRIALTDYCNLDCVFCSNEGMGLTNKNLRHTELESVRYLLRVAREAGVTSLSLTGGEPSLYPNLTSLLKYVDSLKFNQTFFHTNGVALSPLLIDDHLRSFTKVAVSIHSIEFAIWQSLTRGTIGQFDKLMANLDHLGHYSRAGELMVEIKCVPMRGVNDSPDNIKSFLDYCSDNKFKFKFLNFEPISPDQYQYQMTLDKISDKVKDVGAVELPPENAFRGQAAYLPLNWFRYKNTKGVVIEIGCGQKEACEACAHSNEVFVKPNLELKPCHVDIRTFELMPLIKSGNDQGVIAAMDASREFLSKKPGLGATHWTN